MTLRDQAAALLPGVREEIRLLRQLETALLEVVERQVVVPEASTIPVTPVPAPAPPTTLTVVPDPDASLTWTPAERRNAVLQTLKASSPQRVARIAAALNIAQSAAQRDIEDLVKAGLVARVDHGTYGFVQVAWSGASRTPLADVEHPALARRASA